MVKLLIALLFLWQVNTSASALEEVRNKFPHFESKTEVDNLLKRLDADDSSLANVYKGALYMFKSKYDDSPILKYKHFKKGKNLIDQACTAAPNSLEIRFIRLIFQYQLPGFLNYNDHKEYDFKFFISNFNSTRLPADKKYFFLNSLLNLEKLEPEKVKQLKQLR